MGAAVEGSTWFADFNENPVNVITVSCAMTTDAGFAMVMLVM